MKSVNQSENLPSIKYNDLFYRIVMSIIAAHILVLYYDEEPFFSAFFTISYWKGLTGSFVIAMILTAYIHYVTVSLDKKHDWHTDTTPRLFWQGMTGLAAPAILAFLLATLFFWINGYNILKTTYLSQDFTLIVFMLLVINLYYWGLNSFLKHREIVRSANLKQANDTDKLVPVIQELVEGLKDDGPAKAVIVIDTLTRSIPLKTDSISYCYILAGYVFVRTDEMESLNDSYQVSANLRAIENQLDKRMFFRINRQMIVNFNSCESYRSGKNKTLELILNPAPYKKDSAVPPEHERLFIVSEDRVSAFKKWMDR